MPSQPCIPEHFSYSASPSGMPASTSCASRVLPEFVRVFCSSVSLPPTTSRPSGSLNYSGEPFPTSSSRPQSPTGQSRPVAIPSFSCDPVKAFPPAPAPCIPCTSPQCQCHESQADTFTNSLTPVQLATANPVAYSVDICALYRLLLPHTELSCDSINSG
jgi:hypothetical protein